MTFLSLLEASLRYRQATWQFDVTYVETDFEKRRAETIKKWTDDVIAKRKIYPDGKQLRNWARDFDKRKETSVAEYKLKQENFNKTMLAMVADTYNSLDDNSRAHFSKCAASYGKVLEEMFKAKNPAHFLTICRVYNEGGFDNILSNLKQTENEKTKHPDINATNDSVSQEQQQTGIITVNDSNGSRTGHLESGELQDGVILNADGTKHFGGTDPEV